METDFFDIVANVLQGETLASYVFIICIDSVLRTSIDWMKENGFTLKKARSRRYPVQTITDADDSDNRALPENTPAQAETLLYCLEKAADGTGLHVNTDKTEYMCFNQNHPWNLWTNSPTSGVESHLLKMTSIRD